MGGIMNEAELYKASNSLQKRDAVHCLQEYSDRIKWKNERARIIDIGCGDGSVTTEVLKTYVPGNYERLVGCDISEKMIQFANKNYRDQRTEFRVLDIEVSPDDKMKGKYDHLFSFYALHWVKQQSKAFSNIYELLADGGDCLLLFLGHMPLYDIYRKLSTNPKWSFWVKDVERYISPYHDSQCPEKEIKMMMEDIGFTDVDVTSEDHVYVFDKIDYLKKAVMAVNPFGIPKELQDDFMEDYLDMVRKMRLMDDENNNHIGETVAIRADYTVIVAYGQKPA